MIRLYIGKCAAGKDTALKKDVQKGFTPIVSMTTRPMRPGEENGVDYNFVQGESQDEKNEKFLKLVKDEGFIEYVSSSTEIDGKPATVYYGTPVLENAKSTPYVGVVTPKGALSIINYYKDFPDVGVEVIYITVPEHERKRRAINRAGHSFSESWWGKRVQSDNKDFSDDILDQLAEVTPIISIRDYSNLNDLKIDKSTRDYSPVMVELTKGFFAYISPANTKEVGTNGIYTEIFKMTHGVAKTCGAGVLALNDSFEEIYTSTTESIKDALEFVYSDEFKAYLKDFGVKKLPEINLDRIDEYLGIDLTQNEEIER